MRILSVKPYKKHYFKLENDSDPLILHQDTVFKHNLLNARSIDEKTLASIKDDDSYNSLMQRSIDLLARKAYAKNALVKELKKYDKEGAMLNSVIAKLEELGYINDQKALSQMVEETMLYDLKGPDFIRHKCENEGFEHHSIEDALSAFTDDLQREKIRTLIKRENKHFHKLSLQKRKEKLFTSLYRKGFSPELFKPLVEAFLNEIEATTDEAAILEKRLDALRPRYDTNDFKERQKLVQKLMREGFSYSQIKRHL